MLTELRDVVPRLLTADLFIKTVRFLGLPMERIVGSDCCTLMHGASCPVDGCPC